MNPHGFGTIPICGSCVAGRPIKIASPTAAFSDLHPLGLSTTTLPPFNSYGESSLWLDTKAEPANGGEGKTKLGGVP